MSAAVFAEGEAPVVQSANVVGYNKIATNPDEVEAEYPTLGFTFQPLDDEDGWVTLKNVKAEGMDAYSGDYLYLLLPEDATPDSTMLSYFDREQTIQSLEDIGDPYTEEDIEACIGWWEGFTGDVNDKLDDVSYPAGTSFIGLILGHQNFFLTCAGVAKKVAVPVNISAALYPTFANPVPREIKLGEMTATGMMSYDGDYFYHLLPEDATPDNTMLSYYNREQTIQSLEDIGDPYTEDDIEDCIGWWEGFTGDPNDKFDDTTVKPGESFIGLMLTGAETEELTTVVAFPAAY